MPKLVKLLKFFVETSFFYFTVRQVRLTKKHCFASKFRQFYKFGVLQLLGILCACTLPVVSHAAIIFSEIAWMGTAEDANNEWIELYNHDASPVDVEGWSISDGVSLNIALTGTIPGRTIVLLERTDDSTVPGVSAFLVYTGALANEGRTLTLKRADGSTEDRVVGGENWTSIGGDNVTKKTPQGTMTGWVTGTPTPGAPNVEHDTNTESEEEHTPNTSETVSNTNTSKTSTEIRSSSKSSGKTPFVMSTAVLTLEIQSPTITYVNTPISLSAVPSDIGKTITQSLRYAWNFGDAYVGEGKTVTHTFAYPGEYVVVLRGAYARHDTVVQKVITVLPVTLSLARTSDDNIVLTNNATHDIDLGGYTLTGGKILTFPPHSILRSGKSLTIDRSRVEGARPATVSLFDIDRGLVASEVQADEQFASGSAVASPQVRFTNALPLPKQTDVVVQKTPTVSRMASTTGTTSPLLRDISHSIPLYNVAEASNGVGEKSPVASKLPYVGLVGIMLLGILGLYTRKGDSGTM